MSMSLRKIEELHEVAPKQYNGCLSLKERQLMADIYQEAKIRPVKPSVAKFYRYRKNGAPKC